MFKLAVRQPDGCTLREHLEAAARQSGDWSELRLPPLPAGCAIVWRAFQDISAGRAVGFGPGAIPPSEVIAWQQLSGVILTPWEAEAIAHIDRVSLRVMNESKPKPPPRRR